MVCHNYEDSSVSSMSYHLANRLMEEGNNVVFISKSPYFEKETQRTLGSATLVLTSWPSKIKNSSFRDFSWFIQIFKRFRPKVIFGHYNGGLIANILAKLVTFGKVTTVDYHHTCSQGYILDKGGIDPRLGFFLFRRAIYYHLFCDHVICPSPYALNDLRGFFKYKSGYVIPHALLDRYTDKRALRSASSDLINLCYLGRLDSGKNLDDLREALKIHHQTYPNSKIVLHLAGFNLDSKRKSEVEYLDFIEEQGKLDYDKVDEFLQSHDYCLIPSKSDSFNLVAIEALMNNTRLIISDQCGVTDFLNDGVDCIKFTPSRTNISKLLEELEFGRGKFENLKPRAAFLEKFQMDLYLDRMHEFFIKIS